MNHLRPCLHINLDQQIFKSARICHQRDTVCIVYCVSLIGLSTLFLLLLFTVFISLLQFIVVCLEIKYLLLLIYFMISINAIQKILERIVTTSIHLDIGVFFFNYRPFFIIKLLLYKKKIVVRKFYRYNTRRVDIKDDK